jgi:hypothetical protein
VFTPHVEVRSSEPMKETVIVGSPASFGHSGFRNAPSLSVGGGERGVGCVYYSCEAPDQIGGGALGLKEAIAVKLRTRDLCVLVFPSMV